MLAGVLLGLAIATKFYPLMFVGALFLLTPAHPPRWRPFLVTTGSAVAAWLVVNVPFMILAWDGWRRFYVFSQERGVDWGSPWLVLPDQGLAGARPPPTSACLGIVSAGAALPRLAVLTLSAPRRPRLAQICFLDAGPRHDDEQGVVAAVRALLAGALRRAGQAQLEAAGAVAGGRGVVLLRHLALPAVPAAGQPGGPRHRRRHLPAVWGRDCQRGEAVQISIIYKLSANPRRPQDWCC